jgi:hypothetical protein
VPGEASEAREKSGVCCQGSWEISGGQRLQGLGLGTGRMLGFKPVLCQEEFRSNKMQKWRRTGSFGQT